MKIKIVKCSGDFWYKDKIGRMFEECEGLTGMVVNTRFGAKKSYIVYDNINKENWVLLEDAVEISCTTCKNFLEVGNGYGCCCVWRCDGDYSRWELEKGVSKMENEMPELKAGMVVERNNHNKYLVLNSREKLFLANTNTKSWLDIHKNEIEKIFEIILPMAMVSVFDVSNLKLIWERQPSTDWSKIPVDTKVLAKYNNDGYWLKRYFAKYENGKAYIFEDGATSFTAGKTDDWMHVVDEIVLYEGNENLVKENF